MSCNECGCNPTLLTRGPVGPAGATGATGATGPTGPAVTNAWLKGGNTVGNDTTTIGTIDNHDWLIITNNTEVARMTKVGFLGIGTNAPQTRLHVSSNDAFATIVSSRYETNTTAPAGVLGLKASGTATSPTQVLVNNEMVALSARGYHSGAAFGTASTGTAIFYAAENFTLTNQGTSFKIGTTPIGSTTIAYNFRITSEGLVGINTAAPTARLQITGAHGYDQFNMATTFTPANSADANGHTGDVSWDSGFIYIKTAAGAWKRVAIAAF